MNTKYNIAVWSDMDIHEKKAYHIAEAYHKAIAKRGIFFKALTSAEAKNYEDANHIRAHKNWKYFTTIADEFKYSNAFDAGQFMEAVFREYEKEKFPLPAQCVTKTAIRKYKEFREKMRNIQKDDEKSCREQIYYSGKYIQSKVGGRDIYSVERFFLDVLNDEDGEASMFTLGTYAAMSGLISPLYFSVSKSFWKAYATMDQDVRDEIMEKDRLTDMAVWVRLHTGLYDFACQVFPGDIS